MSFTVQEVISGARAWHPSFSEQKHSNTVLFDWLTSCVRMERRKLQSLVPEMLLEQTQAALPFTPFSEGIPLQNIEQVHSISAVSGTGQYITGTPVPLIPLEHLQDIGAWPAAVWIGGGINRLYLKGSAADWVGFQSLLINYIPVITNLAALNDVILMPDPLLDVCIAAMCVFMAMRGGGELVGPEQMKYLVGREIEARGAAETALSAQRAGEVWRIRELA